MQNGLIAAGLVDGTVAVWDPAPMLYATPPGDGAEIAPIASDPRQSSSMLACTKALPAQLV